MADFKVRGGAVGIAGAAEMERLLKLLPERVAERVTKNALRAGARVIRDEAKDRVPVDTGDLRDSVVVRSPTQRQRKHGAALVVVGFEKPISRRAHLTEFGTQHQPAQPFLRPAVDEGGRRAIDAIGKSMTRGINREAKKLAKT